MIREAHGFGETILEAQENAIRELGAGIEDDVQFETVSQPKKKVLGVFGGAKAEVRAFIEMPDEKPKKEKKAEKPAQKSEAKQKKQSEKKQSEKTVTKPASVVKDDFKNTVDASEIPAASPCGRAIAYLTYILNSLGCENLTVKAAEKDNGAYIVIDGDGIGAVIGHRGETLDALQYLTSLAANNGNGYFKVSLNIGNYREKREQVLFELASKVSKQVLSTGKSRRLEPMNPYERRLIHTAVQEIEGVTSTSVGEGSGRRVVILPEGAKLPVYRDRDDRRRSHRGDRRPSSTVASAPTREPKKDSDMPLYGKIN